MLSQGTEQIPQVQIWHIDRLVFYARNPRKNDAAVDRMCGSIREFGFKIPVLARSDGTVVDGHLRLKSPRKLGSWPGGDTTGIPVILCDEWTEAQLKAFRLLVNRSVAWADWDAEPLRPCLGAAGSRATPRPRYGVTLGQPGGRLWSWPSRSGLPMCGPHPNSHGRSWMCCCGPLSSPTSKLFGTKREPFSPGPPT